MQNDIKFYAFDVDGTLLKGNGKTLQPGVLVLMKEISKTGKPIMFISGKTYKEIQDFVSILRKKMDVSEEEFRPIIASHGGNFVEDIGINNTISVWEARKINAIVAGIDKGAITVYKTKKDCLIERAVDADGVSSKIQKGAKKALIKLIVGLNLYDLRTTSASNKLLTQSLLQEKVYSLNIVSLKKVTEITNALAKEIPNMHFIPNGPYLDVFKSNKFEVVQMVIKKYGVSLKDVAYFGDSNNDEECLKYCGVGFLCNAKAKRYGLLQKLVSKPNKYATNDLGDPELIKAVTNEKFDEKVLQDKTQEIATVMKEKIEKKEKQEKTL